MKKWDLFRAWGRVLTGYPPALSVEITKECPLSCPGCYAYQPEHVSGLPLRSFSDRKGDELVEGVLQLVAEHRPLVLYLVGGEPLVRFRELNKLLPVLDGQNIQVRLVTSAVRPIPLEWADLKQLEISVSVDGLQSDHDLRRKPATYERILKHIQGHRIRIHWTLTRQMMETDGAYLEKFVAFWSERPEIRSILVSLYTPQIGEDSAEILSSIQRGQAAAELLRLRRDYPVLEMGPRLAKTYLQPPLNPTECLFARICHCVSADLKTPVTPCQLGGNPDCSQCGCLASIGLHSVAEYRLPVGIRIRTLFDASDRLGRAFRRLGRC